MPPPSAVWLYAKRKKNAAGESVAQCNECGKELAYSGTPSTMRTHLESVHKIQLPKLTPKRKPAKAKRSASNLEDDNPDDPAEMSADGSNLSFGDAEEASSNGTRTQRTPTHDNPNRGERGTLLESWKEMTSFAEGGSRHQEVTDAMLFMMAHDNMPLRTPEREGFRVFCKKLNPRYKIPCEPTTTKKMSLKHKSLRARVKEELGKTKGLTLTMDIWTSNHKMESFLGVTVHYLKGVYMKTIELTARPLKGHKTSANLKIEIDKICEQWNISPDNVNAVVTDGGGNIKGAVKEAFGTSKHISCFGHMLNLMGTKAIGLYKKNIIPSEMAAGDVPPQLPEQESDIEDDEEVTVEVEARGRQAAPGAPANVDSGELLSDLLKKVKKIVTFFRQSEVATSELKKNQMDAGKKENEVLKLIQECRTRWNSAYEMVERFLKLSDYVTLTLMKVHREKSTKATPPSMLSNEEIGYLAEVRDLLRPLYQATVEASADKHVTISKVIPLVNLMREKIYEFIPESGIAFNLRTQLLEDIKTNFGTLEFGKIFSVATLIDPRFKALPFKNKDALKIATNHLASLMRAKMAAPDFEEPAEEQPLPPPATQAEEDDLWSSLDRNVQAHRAARQSQPAPAVVPPPPNRIPEELQRYLDMPNCNRKKFPNPIEYLETIKDKFPYIYEVAREVLPIVATSTPCERLFSHAGLIFTQLRNRLHGSKVDELVFLRSVDEEMWFSVQVP